MSRIRFKQLFRPHIPEQDQLDLNQFIYVHPSQSVVVAHDEAAEMHVIIDRMSRGVTPSTRVAEYSEMLCSGTYDENTKTLLDNPPVDINDPTDVPDINDLTAPDVTTQDPDPLNQTE